MDFALSQVQQALIDAAATVARESLAPRAQMYDRACAFPRESWHDLWRHGFLAIAVPTAYGGMGLDMPSYVMVLEQLAQGCTNTAMTLHMAEPTVTSSEIASTRPPGEPKPRKMYLCRCGRSINKPFCDGAHKKDGFKARVTVG